MSETLGPLRFSFEHEQRQSPLFSRLPSEIREEIFAFVLSSYDDTTRAYQKETYWTRPGHYGPQHVSTGLLRTCKRIYTEAWFMPFIFAEHTEYLTASDRKPRSATWSDCLKIMDADYEKLQPRFIRIFAQMWVLEPGDRFQQTLDMPHFYPKQITLTIRYTDFWFWEDDEPLRIDSTWVNKIRFPESVSRFCIEFESIERRKNEVDYIAREAAEKWYFRRKDGFLLTPHESETPVFKWTGSSCLGGERWIRDEVRPGELDYYVKTVTWKLSREHEARPGCPKLQVPYTMERELPPYLTGPPCLDVDELRTAEIPSSLPAAEAHEALEKYRQVYDVEYDSYDNNDDSDSR
ncbi:hypothetical protein BDV38DRAFT_27357 [Aspergillus pseudotamarii]|uniref:Uncharacterized protein n=1 Tax=Aspergillus pseudotamarii TaxID=132259 RepID=A0A5N6T1K5_ASPPS|nr:uncharacterized protein BDV38DRAFT_27357 [Aspergillus pseudotamarii]KAE8140173.1 hypothetical protein BDV38DRAFT_27357 [Aspergillus pseudotamarii]